MRAKKELCCILQSPSCKPPPHEYTLLCDSLPAQSSQEPLLLRRKEGIFLRQLFRARTCQCGDIVVLIPIILGFSAFAKIMFLLDSAFQTRRPQYRIECLALYCVLGTVLLVLKLHENEIPSQHTWEEHPEGRGIRLGLEVSSRRPSLLITMTSLKSIPLKRAKRLFVQTTERRHQFCINVFSSWCHTNQGQFMVKRGGLK